MVGDALAVPADDAYRTEDEFNEYRGYPRIVSLPPLPSLFLQDVFKGPSNQGNLD